MEANGKDLNSGRRSACKPLRLDFLSAPAQWERDEASFKAVAEVVRCRKPHAHMEEDTEKRCEAGVVEGLVQCAKFYCSGVISGVDSTMKCCLAAFLDESIQLGSISHHLEM